MLRQTTDETGNGSPSWMLLLMAEASSMSLGGLPMPGPAPIPGLVVLACLC